MNAEENQTRKKQEFSECKRVNIFRVKDLIVKEVSRLKARGRVSNIKINHLFGNPVSDRQWLQGWVRPTREKEKERKRMKKQMKE